MPEDALSPIALPQCLVTLGAPVQPGGSLDLPFSAVPFDFLVLGDSFPGSQPWLAIGSIGRRLGGGRRGNQVLV